MQSVMGEPATNESVLLERDRTCQQDQDEAEIAERIRRGINEAKAAVSAKLNDGKLRRSDF